MAKIMGNIVGLPSPRSDWKQTDEMKADYIKNKPTIPTVDDFIIPKSKNAVSGGAVAEALELLAERITDNSPPIKGIDYFTETEKIEMVDDVFNVLKEMNAFDIVSFISNTKVTLNPGRIYFFESTGDSYKVQLYDQDGKVQSQIDESMGGIILYPSSGLAKYISIKEKPSSLGLSDLLNFRGMFDKFVQTTTFNVNTEKPYIYLETVDNHNFWCWEITGNSCDLQIGTYAMKELIEGITAELSVSFIYPLEFDEYAVAIDGVEIERQSYGGTMRIATELLKAKNTQIVFYRNDEEVIKARVNPTILNCGMLYAVER